MLFLVVTLILWILQGRENLVETTVLRAGEPTLRSLFTSHLLHLSGYHLSFSLIIILIAGGVLETRWGTPGFIAFYLLTAWGTSALNLASALCSEKLADSVSCGSAGVALGTLAAVGFLYPEHKLIWFSPPAKYLVWVVIFLGAMGLEFLDLSTSAMSTFLLPQVSGVVFGLGCAALETRVVGLLDAWRSRREREARRRAALLRERVDELLDKINAKGYESLSGDEKAFLREASKHYKSR